MANQFDSLNAEVKRLQDIHDKLVAAIPKLAVNKRLAAEELSKVNKQLVKAQEQLDTLKEEIVLRTDAYNTWQRGELSKLNKAKVTVANDRKQLEDDTAAQDAHVKEAMDAVERAAEENSKTKASLDRQQIEAKKQVDVNNLWAERLRSKDTQHKNERQELINMGTLAGQKSAELHEREQKVADAEKEAQELVKAAERDRKAAKTLLDNAKDSIANNDAREQALDIREKLLKDKERKLKVKEIQLNDRAGVLNGGGL